MREIARKAAKMEQSVFVLIEKPDGTYYFVKDGENYTGTFIEYIYGDYTKIRGKIGQSCLEARVG